MMKAAFICSILIARGTALLPSTPRNVPPQSTAASKTLLDRRCALSFILLTVPIAASAVLVADADTEAKTDRALMVQPATPPKEASPQAIPQAGSSSPRASTLSPPTLRRNPGAILKKAASKAIGGGKAGALAAVAQVCT